MKMLDLSKFEKVKEDKNTTTMRHKDGHEMTILVAALPKIQREQLKRLKMAEGGVAKYDDGTPDAPVSPDDAQSSQDGSTPDHSTNITINTPGAQGSPTAPVGAAPSAAPVPNENQPMAGTTPVQNNPAVKLAQASTDIPVPKVPQTPSNLNPDGTMNPAAVAKNTQTASQLQGDINASKAGGATNIEQKYIEAAAQAAQVDQQNLNDIKGHVDSFNQYVQKNPIDPNHYMQSASTGQKIANAFGLLAGGFTGGFNGSGNNPAMDFINSQIERDIQGQRERLGQQKTVLGAYEQLYGHSVAANSAAKASMLDIYAHQFNLLAAKLGTPQAAQAAMAFGANAAVEKSKLLQDAAVNLRSLPGYSNTNQGTSQPGQISKSKAPSKGGASGSWGAPADSEDPDVLLKPKAVNAYQSSLSKFNRIQTPEEKNKIQNEYAIGQQAGKSIAAIKQLWPELLQNKTVSGYLSDQINPAEAGVAGGGIGALLGGTSGAALGAGMGAGAGLLAEKGLSAIGGDQQIKYETAKNALITQIGSALGEGVNPLEKVEIAKAFAPNWWDSEDTSKNKLEKLIQKIKLVSKTPTLDELGLTKR